jgi:hypothetical protein
LNEAYSHLKKTEIRQTVKFFETLIADLNRWGENQKKTRKPRKKRVVPAARKVARLKFQQTDTALKLESVSAESIVGATELWTYNTKYAKLTRYVATDRAGLDLKGQTLQNFDTAASTEKRVGRKAEAVLADVLAAGKIKNRKMMDTIKAKGATPTGRINDSTILLKVAK